MRRKGKQLGKPYEDFTDTKANIEARTDVALGAHATATDNPSAPFGVYDCMWHWSDGESGGGSGISDAPSDSIYYGRRNAVWTNLKTYFDGIYAALADAYSDEKAQDAVGAMIADTASINLTYTDATPELKADAIFGSTAGTVAEGNHLQTADKGGTGIANDAGSTLTLGAATSITGGGTLALGGYTLTVPATGTAALLGTANVFTAAQDISNNNLKIGSDVGLSTRTNNTAKNGLITLPHYNNAEEDIAVFGIQSVGGSTSINYGGNASGYNAATQINFITAETKTTLTGTARMQIISNGFVKISDGGGNPSTRLHVQDTVATGVRNIPAETLRLEAIVTGGIASLNGFGVGLSFYAETATDGTNQQQGLISTSWIDATNATRKAKMSLSAYDTAARLGLEIEAGGSAAKISFYGGTTVVRGAALTTQLTSITHTAPGTPDYAIQDLVDSSGGAAFGFATKDEGNTVLSVILNLQTRVAELEARLGSATGVNLFA